MDCSDVAFVLPDATSELGLGRLRDDVLGRRVFEQLVDEAGEAFGICTHYWGGDPGSPEAAREATGAALAAAADGLGAAVLHFLCEDQELALNLDQKLRVYLLAQALSLNTVEVLTGA
jgi:hypothetical protein